MTILHMLPSLVQISFSQKQLSIVTKLKGSVNGTFPVRTDMSFFFFLSKFHMSTLNTTSHYSYHLSLILGGNIT